MKIELTKKELAEIAGYSYRRIYEIDRDMPSEKKLFVLGENGKYDLSLFVHRWAEYNANDRGKDRTLDEVRADHEEVKMQKTEIEVRRLRGELVDIQDVKRLWEGVAKTVMQNMLLLPSKLAPQLVMMGSTDNIQAIIDNEINAALSRIADTPLPDNEIKNDEENDEED